MNSNDCLAGETWWMTVACLKAATMPGWRSRRHCSASMSFQGFRIFPFVAFSVPVHTCLEGGRDYSVSPADAAPQRG